jgi:hypothetical protein
MARPIRNRTVLAEAPVNRECKGVTVHNNRPPLQHKKSGRRARAAEMPMGFGVKQTGVGGPLLLNIAGPALLAEADQAGRTLGVVRRF